MIFKSKDSDVMDHTYFNIGFILVKICSHCILAIAQANVQLVESIVNVKCNQCKVSCLKCFAWKWGINFELILDIIVGHADLGRTLIHNWFRDLCLACNSKSGEKMSNWTEQT